MLRQSQLIFIGTLLYCSPVLAQTWSIKQDIDPAKVAGHESCVECHKSEVDSWKQSGHFTKAHQKLLQDEAKEIADSMQVQNVLTDQRCTTCHGTQQIKAGQLSVIKAVSCESCHGAAGNGSGDWLKVHGSYGKTNGVENQRLQEPRERFEKRLADCDNMGMRRSENLYALAKNCVECHVVPSEELVNNSKHPAGSETFEFVSWAQGEVRHNFRLNPEVNAAAPTLWTNARFTEGRTEDGHRRLMYVVGQLADLEVSLRSRASATQRGKFLNALRSRITKAQRELKRLAKAGPIPELDRLPDIAGSQLRKTDPQDAKLFTGFADQVAAIGKAVTEKYDGNQWADIEVRTSVKGDVYLGK